MAVIKKKKTITPNVKFEFESIKKYNKRYLLTKVFKKLRIYNGLNFIKFSNERMFDYINHQFTYVNHHSILQYPKFKKLNNDAIRDNNHNIG